MTILVPYESSGQQLGETRTAMTKRLMEDLEAIINRYKDKKEKYYVLFHAKPDIRNPKIIRIKPLAMSFRPRMMLSCVCFGVDNVSGVLTLEYALPGDWPTWSVGGTNDPVPETIASIEASGVKYHYENFLPD